jgi:LysR family glycine cleavage system transcriptional activator
MSAKDDISLYRLENLSRKMAGPLPPLNALRAFEATARHLSFSKAAQELHVTPAALSHQIHGLEDFLGLKLFHRRTRAIELTEAGRLIFPGIRTGFEALREALARLDRGREDRILVVSATPAFTVKWLVPRLYRFLEAHPEIDARISASLQLADFGADGVDVAIRFSVGVAAKLHAEKLMDESLLPFCSPRLVEGPHGLKTPQDLARFTLIHIGLPAPFPSAPSWSDWLQAAGVEGVDTTRGLQMNVTDHALDAAVAGAGVVLAQKVLASGDVRAGRLVAPFSAPELPYAGRSYFLVCPQGHERRPKVRAFRDWLLSEINEP